LTLNGLQQLQENNSDASLHVGSLHLTLNGVKQLKEIIVMLL
jgi:hypothetical protein